MVFTKAALAATVPAALARSSTNFRGLAVETAEDQFSFMQKNDGEKKEKGTKKKGSGDGDVIYEVCTIFSTPELLE